jgi:hypothetical protein
MLVFPRQDDSGVAATGSGGKEAVGDGLQEHGGGGAQCVVGINFGHSVDTHVDNSDVNTSQAKIRVFGCP